MQIPRIDPLPPVYGDALQKVKGEERASVSSPATAAQLEPVSSRTRERGRDPTLDPTRQRRERGQSALDDNQRRGGSHRPSSRPSEPPETPVPTEALKRAVAGNDSAPPPPLDVSARAFDMISEWGRERLQSGDLESNGAPSSAPAKGPASATFVHGHAHEAVDCAFCKALMRAYKSGM